MSDKHTPAQVADSIQRTMADLSASMSDILESQMDVVEYRKVALDNLSLEPLLGPTFLQDSWTNETIDMSAIKPLPEDYVPEPLTIAK